MGYSRVSKHHEGVTRGLKERAKEEEQQNEHQQPSSSSYEPKKRASACSFRVVDLSTRMYPTCGSSPKLEMDASDRAVTTLSMVEGVTLGSVRLDRYCGTPEYVDLFGRETEVYLMPKSNATLSGSWRSKETMIEFVKNAVKYLEEYHKRCNSESGFAGDKKVLGWSIAQRRGTGLTAPTSAPAMAQPA